MTNSYANPAQQYAQQYKAQNIQTASKEEILIMLFDGAIRFSVIAKKAMNNGDIEKCHTHLIKTQNILTELMISLDMEIGGEMAKNLYKLYDYLHYQLVQANVKKDPALIDEVLHHLRDLKKTWEEAIKIAKNERKPNSDSEPGTEDVSTDRQG